MKLIYIFLLFFAATAANGLYAQQHSLTGRVRSAVDSRPLQGVTVKLTGITGSSISDEQGRFYFDNLAAGSYFLSLSFLGFEPQRITVTLPGDRDLAVAMSPATAQLQAVEIIGRKEQTYKNTSSFAGTKTETPLRYVPQAISYVTKEVIDDQQAFKTSDILKNISGVNVFSFYNNDFTLRGFRAEMH